MKVSVTFETPAEIDALFRSFPALRNAHVLNGPTPGAPATPLAAAATAPHEEPSPDAVPVATAEEGPKKRGRGRPRKDEKNPPNADPVTPSIVPPAPAGLPDGTVTMEDVKVAMRAALASGVPIDKVKAVFAKHGAPTKMANLQPQNFAPLIRDLQALQSPAAAEPEGDELFGGS